MLHEKYNTLFEQYEVNTPLRLAHFYAQAEHESGLKAIAENLNYSADGLFKIFPKYFNKAQAVAYARQPQRIANKVYASRMGNGDEASNDGWNYRGKGILQITGRSNYHQLSKDTSVNFEDNPDWLLEEANAVIAALWFWQKNNINIKADADDIIGVRKKVNGGTIGLDDCKLKLEKWKQKQNI